jgi:hypothetical protein
MELFPHCTWYWEPGIILFISVHIPSGRPTCYSASCSWYISSDNPGSLGDVVRDRPLCKARHYEKSVIPHRKPKLRLWENGRWKIRCELHDWESDTRPRYSLFFGWKWEMYSFLRIFKCLYAIMKPSKFTFISPAIYDTEFIDLSPKCYLSTKLQDTHISLSNASLSLPTKSLLHRRKTWK